MLLDLKVLKQELEFRSQAGTLGSTPRPHIRRNGKGRASQCDD